MFEARRFSHVMKFSKLRIPMGVSLIILATDVNVGDEVFLFAAASNLPPYIIHEQQILDYVLQGAAAQKCA